MWSKGRELGQGSTVVKFYVLFPNAMPQMSIQLSFAMFACTACYVFVLSSNVACGVCDTFEMSYVLVCACVCVCVCVCARAREFACVCLCVWCVCQVEGAQQLKQDLACPRKPEEGPGP